MICLLDSQDSRQELMQLFDESVGMTGKALMVILMCFMR